MFKISNPYRGGKVQKKVNEIWLKSQKSLKGITAYKIKGTLLQILCMDSMASSCKDGFPTLNLKNCFFSLIYLALINRKILLLNFY